MLKEAEARTKRMLEAGATSPRRGTAAISTRYRGSMPRPVATPATFADARQSALQCRRCGLCEAATQTVWGEGNETARLMIVGKQPGDAEDLAGRPFVGPAGQLLRALMAEAWLETNEIWLTSAVKHFKFVPRGKQRLRQTADRQEIEHCRWWLDKELTFIQPCITLAMGASAVYALTGVSAPLGHRRGQIETGLHGGAVLISWHPAYILRQPEGDAQARKRQELLEDLMSAKANSFGQAKQPGP